MPTNDIVFSRRAAIAGAASAFVAANINIAPVRAATKIRFLTNWFAEAEHGGFYQAKATGLYDKAGLDVDIQMGGPQVNGMQLLGGGDPGQGGAAGQAVGEHDPRVPIHERSKWSRACLVSASWRPTDQG